jgi:hypothetical protein
MDQMIAGINGLSRMSIPIVLFPDERKLKNGVLPNFF